MTTVTSPWPGLGQPLFEMCWVYMAIAQIAQDPPLCQMDKRARLVRVLKKKSEIPLQLKN